MFSTFACRACLSRASAGVRVFSGTKAGAVQYAAGGGVHASFEFDVCVAFSRMHF